MYTLSIVITLTLLLGSLIYWLVRRKTAGLSWWQCILFLGAKVMAGCAYGYVYGHYYGGDDTWGLNHDSFVQFRRLKAHPLIFLQDFFPLHPHADADLYFGEFTTRLEYWEFSLVTKLLAPFNCISQGNYYINVVFFCFLSFWGAYFLYKLLLTELGMTDAARKITPISIALFLFLPVLFWLSGIRAEGLLLSFTAILLYYFRKCMLKPHIGYALICLLAFAGVFILRNNFAMLLLPALLGWWLAIRKGWDNVKSFGLVYLLLFVVVTVTSFLPPAYDLLRPVVKAQQSFFTLHGNTRYHLTPLEYNMWSFLLVAPEAMVNTILRPWPWEAKGALQWLVALENIVLWGLLLIVLVRFKKGLEAVLRHPLACALACTALTSYLLIGYIVPFPGAIVRYRVIGELFLLCLLGISMEKSNKSLSQNGIIN